MSAAAEDQTSTTKVMPEMEYKPLSLDISSPNMTGVSPTPLRTTTTMQCSVIQGPTLLTQHSTAARDRVSAFKATIACSSPASDTSSSVLPTCTNANLNSNWIAMKFGAAVGPNRMSYPREFKLMVIDYYYRNGQNKYRTCKEFQITKSMLNGWLQKVDKIRQSRPGSLKSGRSGRRPQFPDIEKQLFALYQTHVATGQKIGNRWIRETARNLARQQCSSEELGGMCQFSERWLSNFKKRYHINLNKDWTPSPTSSCTVTSVSSEASSTVSGVTPNSPVSFGAGGEDKDNTASNSDEDVVSMTTDSNSTLPPTARIDLSTTNEFPTDNAELNNNNIKTEGTKTPPTSLFPGFANVQLSQGLPIHEFYRQFPWLYKRGAAAAHQQQSSYEPGRRGRKVQFPQVEKVLYERLLQRQAAGQRVSNRWLQEQARSLALQLCPEVLAEATKSARCMFSEHWLHNFKKRYGVSIKHQRLQQQQGGGVRTADNGASAITPTVGCRTNATEEVTVEQPPSPAAVAPVARQPSPEEQQPVTPAVGNNGAAMESTTALAAFVQMQQFLLQQYCLQTLAVAQLQQQTPPPTTSMTGAAAAPFINRLGGIFGGGLTPATAPNMASASPVNLMDFYRRLTAEQQLKSTTALLPALGTGQLMHDTTQDVHMGD